MKSCMRRDLLRHYWVVGKSMPTKDVYFLSKFENKTTSYCLKNMV